MAMRQHSWGKTIRIQVEAGVLARREVENTYDAARLLLGRWPGPRGAAFKKAVLDCTLALRGQLPHDAVPNRFADALREAGLDCVIRDDVELDAFFEAEIARVCIESLCEDMVVH
jgi:hypothetical protein